MRKVRTSFQVVASLVECGALAVRLGTTWSDRWRLASSWMAWKYQERIPFLTLRFPHESQVTLRHGGQRFRLWLWTAPGKSDLSVLYEVFGRQEYAVRVASPPKVIVDLGAYTGISAIYFALAFPEAQIYCIEPEPENFERLERNTRPYPNIHCRRYAVGRESGRRPLFLSGAGTSAHSLYPTDGDQGSVEVESVTVEHLIREFGLAAVDILKFDVEGAESEIFRGFPFSVPVQCLVGELHLDAEAEGRFCRLFQGYRISLSKDYFGLTSFRAHATATPRPIGSPSKSSFFGPSSLCRTAYS